MSKPKSTRLEDVPLEDLFKLFGYGPESGNVYWLTDNLCKTKKGKRGPGEVAGRIDSSGYVRITYDGKMIGAHRLVWALVHGSWPSKHIDHIDCDKTNNRIENLREATQSQNQANQKCRSSAGLKGVLRSGSKWMAQCRRDGKTEYLGTFNTPEEAHRAYCKKAHEIHGEFARTS